MINKVHDFIVESTGPLQGAERKDYVLLRHIDDAVRFRGPVTLNISIEAHNELIAQDGVTPRERAAVASLYSYNVEVPAGYHFPFAMRHVMSTMALSPNLVIAIRLGECPPRPCLPDMPCDFAVRHLPDSRHVFPTACEPCGDVPVRMPPTCGPSLTVVPAPGGCVRPRFFNGMFITREDLETELRYFRIKNNLQRRADGQGVVWGLGLGRDGRSICVHPGYAVDCCGNDLTVICTYKVGVAELLADPAICHRRYGEHECFALLLEYVECPEEPRPVHGEPCAGSPLACEMSRVRETVRLRLVPKREHCDKGPIPTFLKKLGDHRKKKDECCSEHSEPCEPWPCLTDQCCGDEKLFSCLPPWGHEDPFNPGRAGDPKAIVLAILYALLAGTIGCEGTDGQNEEKVQKCADLFRAVAKLCDPECHRKGGLDRCALEVQQLLADWCCSLLYPGPCCEGEPHGVVIGCAVVCGNEIERIDPWAGRRWVMHYPLQSYWGEQFGITPPDILASRLFDLICCVAKLERPSCEALCSDDDGRSIEYSIGSAKLFVTLAKESRTEPIGAATSAISRTQTVSLIDFARHVLGAMVEHASPTEGPMMAVRLEGFPEVSLLVPDAMATVEPKQPPASSAEAKPKTPASEPTHGWISFGVKEALELPRIRRIYRALPLFRTFSERLAVELTRRLPVAVAAPPAELAIALERDGVATLGDLLDQDATSFATAMADLALARALSDLIQRGEAKIQGVTEGTIEAVKAIADQHNLASAAALSGSQDARVALAAIVSDRLSVGMEIVAPAIAEALT